MTIDPIPEARTMMLVDCPLCDHPAEFDPDADALDCPACGVRLAVADEAPAASVAVAA